MTNYPNPGYEDDPMPQKPDDQHDSVKPDDYEDTAATAVLPKSILAGKEFNVGDEVVLKIDAIHDDEIVVSYAPAKSEEGAGDEGGKEGGESLEPMARGSSSPGYED